MGIAIIFVVIAFCSYAAYTYKSRVQELRAKLAPAATKVKLAFVFYQVTTLLGPIFQIPYHRLPGYARFVALLGFISFDLDFIPGLDCVMPYSRSFHTKLYATGTFAMSLVFGTIIALMVLFSHNVLRNSDEMDTQQQMSTPD